MKTIYFSIIISFFFTTAIFCQSEVIHIKNPSFEDYPRPERVPEGWIDCGFELESPPDTHPSGAFEVVQTPADGMSFLGLVVRDIDTWEKVGQKLGKPMTSGQCYGFKISLCRSDKYVSISKHTGMKANYVEPTKLVLWGGNSFCDKVEKLGETPLIEHTDWKSYIILFQPQKAYSHIQLEAFYKQPILAPYNGNLLVDNASPMVPVPCDSAAIWNNEKYEALFNDIAPVYVDIEASDVDVSSTLSPTISAERIALRKPISVIYYNSSLDAEGRTKALKAIVEFFNDRPSSKANIIIEEHTKAQRKLQKQKLLRDLKQLGIDKSKCKITLLKK